MASALISVKYSVSGSAQKALRQLSEQYSRLNSRYVAIGWHGDEKYPDGTSVAQVGLFNEFGTRNKDGSVRNPARPFMRPAYRENKPAIDKLRNDVVERVTDGKITAEKALDTLGYNLQLYIQAKIKSNPEPPLAARTLAKKRAAGRPAVTLIDTRRMLDTLNYRIYNGYFGGGERTANSQAMQRVNDANSQKIHGKALDRISRMRTAKQVKRAKQQLRDELRQAKAAKKRADMRLQRSAKKAAKKAFTKAWKAYRKTEKSQKKAAQSNRRANEKHARKSQVRARSRYVKGVKHAIAVKDAYTKRMAKRDRRQAKSLSRLQKLSPKQRAAKQSREKLVKGNKARLRAEKRAERREVAVEKKAAQKLRNTARSLKKAAIKRAKSNAKKDKVARKNAEKKVKKATLKFIKLAERFLPK